MGEGGSGYIQSAKEVTYKNNERTRNQETKFVATDLIQMAPEISRASREKDQGFTRPKILILAPFKRMAYTIIQ